MLTFWERVVFYGRRDSSQISIKKFVLPTAGGIFQIGSVAEPRALCVLRATGAPGAHPEDAPELPACVRAGDS